MRFTVVNEEGNETLARFSSDIMPQRLSVVRVNNNPYRIYDIIHELRDGSFDGVDTKFVGSVTLQVAKTTVYTYEKEANA